MRAANISRAEQHEPDAVGDGAFGVAADIGRHNDPVETDEAQDEELEPCATEEVVAVAWEGDDAVQKTTCECGFFL